MVAVGWHIASCNTTKAINYSAEPWQGTNVFRVTRCIRSERLQSIENIILLSTMAQSISIYMTFAKETLWRGELRPWGWLSTFFSNSTQNFLSSLQFLSFKSWFISVSPRKIFFISATDRQMQRGTNIRQTKRSDSRRYIFFSRIDIEKLFVKIFRARIECTKFGKSPPTSSDLLSASMGSYNHDCIRSRSKAVAEY